MSSAGLIPAELLAAEPLGSGPLLAELARVGRVQRYPKRAVLMTEGDAGESVYLVLEGRVKVYNTHAESGKELVLCECGPGEILGEMALDGGPRSASVMALEPTRCTVIPLPVWRARLAESPALAMMLNRILIQRVRQMTGIARGLALSNVYGRIVNLLLSLAETDAAGEQVVAGKLSRQAIADRVGSSRDMVNRVFKELVKGGYITLERNRIVIRRKLPLDW